MCIPNWLVILLSIVMVINGLCILIKLWWKNQKNV